MHAHFYIGQSLARTDLQISWWRTSEHTCNSLANKRMQTSRSWRIIQRSRNWGEVKRSRLNFVVLFLFSPVSGFLYYVTSLSTRVESIWPTSQNRLTECYMCVTLGEIWSLGFSQTSTPPVWLRIIWVIWAIGTFITAMSLSYASLALSVMSRQGPVIMEWQTRPTYLADKPSLFRCCQSKAVSNLADSLRLLTDG